MIQLEVLKLEINYFLHIIKNNFGYEDKSLAKEAMNLLINHFLFGHNKEICSSYISRINYYISIIEKLDNIEYNNLKFNIPNIIKLLNTIKLELS
ncbi:hypothetical protein [Caloranaerobacter ferrireducens]|uniref:hypothetical protein n=1 Tax=Caloranaerobacter ferrireducens TaxID=1323370 RepID=UPI00084D1D05|nr:hypothetical protein [Caloranaerobacter ferrireducens]